MLKKSPFKEWTGQPVSSREYLKKAHSPTPYFMKSNFYKLSINFKSTNNSFVHLLAGFFLLFALNPTIAQPPKTIEKKFYTTAVVEGTVPLIDGIIDEAAWDRVEWGGDFIQLEPTDGGKATQKTNFKILYDDANIYVAFRCFDTAPDSIVRRMSRRDGFDGDWVEINIDSYNDKRSAFSFTSSVSGVKGDEFISNDGNNWDSSWNPIWFLRTKIDEEGWTAEVKIPLSQLRYADKEEQIWGIQMTRRDFRKESRSIWQYIPNNAGYWVSGFGELRGIKGIKPQKQIELQPYVVAQAETFEKQEGNPFATGRDSKVTGGLDGRIGVTGDLTLDFTINPDFGQVEADPSVIVIDGFQVFFSERRPFFVENRNIFDYQLTGSAWGGGYDSDNLFYSRRIGGAPHGYVGSDPSNNYYADQPQNTTILGAAKFSGKTNKGTAIGILEAVTAKEFAQIDNNGEQEEEIVEPLSNYFVGRVTQDFDGGNTVLGGVFTATNRQLEDTGLDFLHQSAYSGGVDFVHRWKERSWAVSATGLFSNVSGSTEAIMRTQQSFEHSFHRPDATHLSVDTTATSLFGHAGTVKLGKYGGLWKFEVGGTWRSPGLELNDIGFQRNADEIVAFTWGGLHFTNPFSIFRNMRVNIGQTSNWDFSGTHLYQGGGGNVNAMFKNYWFGTVGLFFETKDLSNRALFGGPALRKPTGIAYFAFVSTDNRKKISFNFNVFNALGWRETVRRNSYSVGVRIQPSNALNIGLNPSLNLHNRIIQYVSEQQFGNEPRYIAGTIDQKTFSLTARLNYSITPNLTLQYYGQPFISRGRYSEFKNITDPLNKDVFSQFYIYDNQQLSFDNEGGFYAIDEDRDGQIDYTFGDPDFNFIQFRSNLVARWEYIPGSELFLVWSQGTTNFADPNLRLISGLTDNLFSNQANNIFLVKLTYRFLL